jgi:hypothetical protein
MAIPTATMFELIESHKNTLRHSMADSAIRIAKRVTEMPKWCVPMQLALSMISK